MRQLNCDYPECTDIVKKDIKKAIEELKTSVTDFVQEFTINVVDPEKDFTKDSNISVVDPERDFIKDFTVTAFQPSKIQTLQMGVDGIVKAVENLAENLVKASERSDLQSGILAQEANDIAKRSLFESQKANRYSFWAIIAATVCALVSLPSFAFWVSSWINFLRSLFSC